MKTTSLAFKAELNSEVTTLCTCWKITRTDGKRFFFTSHDQDLTIGGDLYLTAVGYSATAVATDAALSVDNLEVSGFLDSEALSEDEMRAGLFDRAEVELFLTAWGNLAAGTMTQVRGTFGEAVWATPPGMFRTELRGLAQAMAQPIGQVYSAECRANLGDDRCKVPLYPNPLTRSTAYAAGDVLRVASAPTVDYLGFPDSTPYLDKQFTCTVPGTTAAVAPAYSYTPGDTTTDGTAAFLCAEAWAHVGVVGSADVDGRSLQIAFARPDPRAAGIDWLTDGLLTIETGANRGVTTEIKTSVADALTVILFLPLAFPLEVGARVVATPGCDLSRAMCFSRFANVINMRAEPDIPGGDFLFSMVQTH